ncbi:Radical SAM domain protein [Sulfuricurvum kujiense DSM 16994]|uniref:Radical SAM domain protein n=1 Tax=Sulfuricurvum kujiense (strain ATCC BAA-921 / DSM 16994 / JCM 11577 / YK-1) TaxID=709032 RepID=E4TX14_SULKY|nr:radical SAM protein [Sulfuricurvum kujiense]ADR33855.1 Radical SAM domain protein [Sulfuricurvum kujiense DSM 16994]
MINYSFPLYRPPAEADNVILQATYGCSHNQCTFCSMYKTKKYQIREISDLFKDIDTLAALYPDANKVFLGDGDALSLPTEYMITVLQYLKRSFPRLSRVSVYATAQNVLEKSEEELRLLQANLLNLIYFGIETGNDGLLKKINKGVSAKQIIESLNKASAAKIKISATVILGIGGEEYTAEHIKDTAAIINASTINYLSTLQLGLENDVKERFLKCFEHFQMLNDYQILDEQKRFLELLHPVNKVIFRSNHASNALHLAGTLPKDTMRLLDEVKFALAIGERAFIPERFRGF